MTGTSNSIVTPQGPLTGTAVCTTANAAYSGTTASPPTGVQTLIATQTNGARLTRVSALAMATVSATELQLFAYDGTNYRFIGSKNMAAYTVSQTGGQSAVDMGFSDLAPLFLKPGESLCAAIGVANATGICFRAEGGFY